MSECGSPSGQHIMEDCTCGQECGDLVMSYCTGIKSYEEFQDHGCFSFSVALIGAISLCMFVRMLRDLIIIFTRDTDRIETILEVTGGTDE